MTIRVHHYVERDGLSVCKRCGVVENKDATGPRWCPGKTPKIGLRDAGALPLDEANYPAIAESLGEQSAADARGRREALEAAAAMLLGEAEAVRPEGTVRMIIENRVSASFVHTAEVLMQAAHVEEAAARLGGRVVWGRK